MAIVQGELFTNVSIIDDTSDVAKFSFSLNNWYQDSRSDYIILASELSAIGMGANYQITELRVWIKEMSAMTPFSNIRIAMKHTTNTAMASGTFAANSDQYSTFTQVYSASSLASPSTGWYSFTLTTPFTWNGTSNLMVSTSRDGGPTGDSTGQTSFRNVTSTRMRAYFSDSAETFPFDTGNFGGDGAMTTIADRVPRTYLVADSGAPTGTPGTVSYATKQVINRSGSIAYATKQVINRIASSVLATKQSISQVGSIAYATQQTITDGGSPGSVAYSTKQIINQTASLLAATRQSIYQAGSSEWATKQSIMVFVEIVEAVTLQGRRILYVDLMGLFDLNVNLYGMRELNVTLRGGLPVTAENQNFPMRSGNTKKINIPVYDTDGTRVNLTGATITWILVGNNANVTKSTGNGITITDAINGVFQVLLNASDTAGWPEGSYEHEAKITDALSNVSTVTTGQIYIKPSKV